ncbi:hypothetical protein MRX96_018646 [Rhipicephalus microplus]
MQYSAWEACLAFSAARSALTLRKREGGAGPETGGRLTICPGPGPLCGSTGRSAGFCRWPGLRGSSALHLPRMAGGPGQAPYSARVHAVSTRATAPAHLLPFGASALRAGSVQRVGLTLFLVGV